MAPQSHPQAQFVPIPPDFDVDALIDGTKNFDHVNRVSTESLREHTVSEFEKMVLQVVIQMGKPLVIEDWGASLPPWLFSAKWLEDNLNLKHENVRDITNGTDIPMTMGHYLRSMGQLTKQFSKNTYRDPKRQRLYLKDIDCPDEWANHLKEIIPESVYYLNDCIESRTGGVGSILEPNEYGQMRYGKGAAPAGDLMASLPPEMRALNMMCYIGHEGTYTPAHREMCATLGHNIMVEASKDGHGEKAGSSLWFMTETKERELVSEYFLSMLGHDIEVEKHFAQVNAWKKAPFNVWVVEQKVGDLILIPPLAPHQVWNRGTRTMKAAWNRTTVDTLELALHEALPRARMVCRDEQYKCKAIIHYTLVKYFEILQRDTLEPKMLKEGRPKQLLDDFKRLFSLYQEILVSEMFSPKLPEETGVEFLPYDSNVTCSYCRCNIFNRFLTCKSCIQKGPNGEEDTYDICMDCYAMGRSCACISNLSWVEQWDWNSLVQSYEQYRTFIVQCEEFVDFMRSPPTIDVARKRYGKKPIAEVCQEQLKIRPWTDITKPREPTPEMSSPEPEVDDQGRVKKRKPGKGKMSRVVRAKIDPTKDKTHSCHICFHHEWNWKLAFCTSCNLAYCYGVLWRAFDLMPQTVMEDKEWQCPRCLKMCSCAKCRKGNVQVPYKPKGTLLGHDTRKVADYRSVESLVDFSKTNLGWLRDEDADKPHESGRMKRLKEKAEAEKALVDESLIENDMNESFAISQVDEGDHSMEDIDPSLRDSAPSGMVANGNGLHRTLYEPSEGMSDGFGMAPNGVGQDELNPNGWNEAHFEFDDYNPSFSIQAASYPTRLLAPVAPMVASEPSYPDPVNAGQNRMMGIGYYQQGSGADRILYNGPNDEVFDESPTRTGPNPNVAFSDLLDPTLAVQENPKKRRTAEDEDVEFFTSQAQAARAKKAKYEQALDGAMPPAPVRPAKIPPRRSTVMPKSYKDLGEDAVPIEDDEAPSTVSHKQNKENSGSDSTPVVRRAKPKATPKPAPETKRRSMRGAQLDGSSEPQAAPNTIKTPRKSIWLARKEAQDAAEEFPEELPAKRSRRSTTTNVKPATAINISSESSGSSNSSDESHDEDDGGVAIDNDGLDSLFGEPIERLQSPVESPDVPAKERVDESTRGDTPGKIDSVSSTPHLTEETQEKPIPKRRGRPPKARPIEQEEDKPTPKRRGRPPKNKTQDPPVELQSPSPQLPGNDPPEKLLSLREKLALKKKTGKIVAAKEPVIESPGASTTKEDVSVAPALSSPSLQSPVGWTSVNKTILEPDSSIESPAAEPSNRVRTSTSTPSENSHGHEFVESKERHASPSPQPPLKKGPTVVRLMSPSPEYYDAKATMRSRTSSSGSSEDDDDDDIPAVRGDAKPMRGAPIMGARRGRGGASLRGRRGA